MSIIYEALKKVERNNNRENTDEIRLSTHAPINANIIPKQKLRVLFLVLIPIMLSLAVFLGINTYFSILDKKFEKNIILEGGTTNEIQRNELGIIPKTALLHISHKPKTKETLSYNLQGIVYGVNPFAIINGKRLRKADTIDDFTVVDISANTVKLQNLKDNREFTLSFQ